MKRFLVFHGDNYYPNRGMGDFLNSFEDETTAISIAESLLNDTYHKWSVVYDQELERTVFNEDSI